MLRLPRVRAPRAVAFIVVSVILTACHDAAVAPPKPTTVEIVAGASQTGTVGQAVTVTPSFVVKDEHGHAMDGIAVTVSVTAGNGFLVDAPTKTSGPATPIGHWSLGPRVGANQVTIAVPGLTPAIVSAAASAGAPAKLVPLMTTTMVGRVGEVVTPAPTARLTDSYDNPLAAVAVTLTIVGGGTAAPTETTDSAGLVTIANWTLGTVAQQNAVTLNAGTASVTFIAEARPGDPATLTTLTGDAQAGRAGAPLDVPVVLRVGDRFGNGVPDQAVTFAVAAGSGSLASAGATTSATGTATLPAWTLGRMAVPQIVRATSGALTADVNATIRTDFNIDVRFYGPAMTPEQQALFTNAAARLSAIVTGDVPDVAAQPLSLSLYCGISSLPVYNEPLDDVVIYASIQPIDGPGKILAQAGPCLFRNVASGSFAAFGVMQFDVADIANMQTQGTLQAVITHEMLHVLGVGTEWGFKNLLSGAGTLSSTYTGLAGRQGCSDDGGAPVCTTGVPVENNGVPGTADSHWRESTFGNELMTGYVNGATSLPLSLITVGALADLGYVVNPLAADPYRVPSVGALRSIVPGAATDWEQHLPKAPVVIP
jgi:hypothetical protein